MFRRIVALISKPQTLDSISNHRLWFSSSKNTPLEPLKPERFPRNPRKLPPKPLGPKRLPKNRRRKLLKLANSPRVKRIQPEETRIPSLERIVDRDTALRFLLRSKTFIQNQPQRVLDFRTADLLHRELGFDRGLKVSRFLKEIPQIYQIYRHVDNSIWIGFTDAAEELLEEEARLADELESDRITRVRKLLMMSAGRRIPMSKLHHARAIFGFPDDFRDRLSKYPQYFRFTKDEKDLQCRQILELVEWDPSLAVSALEREFVADEEKVIKSFSFTVRHAEALGLDEETKYKLRLAHTLPMVSPYSDGSELEINSLKGEKYRIGVLHEFLNLTLEKRASIHHVVEFKEEFSLTKHTYQMLWRQFRTFYLAGTQMNWAVFLKDHYNHDTGELLEMKDPQLVLNEKLIKLAGLAWDENEGYVWNRDNISLKVLNA